MYPDLIHTSILTIAGTEVCRIWSLDEDFRHQVIYSALRRLAPTCIDAVPEKFWAYIADQFNNYGNKIPMIKLVRTIEPNLSLNEGKALTEFIASVSIRL